MSSPNSEDRVLIGSTFEEAMFHLRRRYRLFDHVVCVGEVEAWVKAKRARMKKPIEERVWDNGMFIRLYAKPDLGPSMIPPPVWLFHCDVLVERDEGYGACWEAGERLVPTAMITGAQFRERNEMERKYCPWLIGPYGEVTRDQVAFILVTMMSREVICLRRLDTAPADALFVWIEQTDAGPFLSMRRLQTEYDETRLHQRHMLEVVAQPQPVTVTEALEQVAEDVNSIVSVSDSFVRRMGR